MTEEAKTPRVQPGGIVTVAFLKAQLDAGSDHLGIFMPLVLDAVARLQSDTFTTADIQEAIAKHHGLAMPQQAVATLLGRATRKKYVQRTMGFYRRDSSHPIKRIEVTARKDCIQQAQERLGEALRNHAAKRQLAILSTSEALNMLFRFLKSEQIELLLGTQPTATGILHTTARERSVVAEFIQYIIRDDPPLWMALRDILEGLVLYQAAFLPGLGTQTRRFSNLQVAFDSTLVRQAIGYEGTAMRALLREAVDILKASGVTCLVFDQTVQEIRRILSMYEAHLRSDRGSRSLRASVMTRHFLTKRYSLADVHEMAALLEHDIGAAGFQVQRTPKRSREYTGGELALAKRLADPQTRDEFQPRVQHDVDCVAAVLTLRGGHRSADIEHARAVFATSSPLVIRNTRTWYCEDEHDTGVEPVVHIRALANLAWLKKPTLCETFKEHELIALCTAALRPNEETWERFLHHLESLEQSRRLSSDEVTAIVVSAMSDRLLREAEDDAGDIDAVTLDDVVDRVKSSYAANAKEQIQEVTNEYESKLETLATQEKQRIKEIKKQYESKLEELTARERAARAEVDRGRQRELAIEGRARAWARWISRTVYLASVAVLLAGALAAIVGHPFHTGWFGFVLGIALVAFVVLELFGILKHVAEWRVRMETCLTRRFRRWLTDDATVGLDTETP